MLLGRWQANATLNTQHSTLKEKNVERSIGRPDFTLQTPLTLLAFWVDKAMCKHRVFGPE
jgi:hypothetical protein